MFRIQSNSDPQPVTAYPFFLRAHTYCSAHDSQRKREQRHVAEVESGLEKPIHPENKQCVYDRSKFEGFLLTSRCSLNLV
jgi:hypothetical protein